VVAYTMYTVSPEVMARFGHGRLYLTTVFVVLGILRYLQITYIELNSGSPTGPPEGPFPAGCRGGLDSEFPADPLCEVTDTAELWGIAPMREKLRLGKLSRHGSEVIIPSG